MFEHYIGIENELSSFKGNKRVDFEDYFRMIRSNQDYSKSDKSIRTAEGLGFYVDGSEIEILTPPIPINKGFSSRLTDSLMKGRDKVVKATPNLQHTGYSMHWNLSRTSNEYGEFHRDIAIPFHLFGLTPLSVGMNVREKCEETPSRIEVLGDSLLNEEQINATALLLGSYSLANSCGFRFPFVPYGINISKNLFLQDGRYNFVDVISTETGESKNVQAQQYLERFHHWLKPFIGEVGTRDERKNLEAFVQGNKDLEFDNFKYFARLLSEGGKDAKSYLPLVVGAKNASPILTISDSKGKRVFPLECLLLGEIIKQKRDRISGIDWDKLYLNGGYSIEGIGELYRYANRLNKELPIYQEALELTGIRPKDIAPFGEEKIRYDPKKDSFEDSKHPFYPIFKGELKKSLKKSILDWGLIILLSTALGAVGAWVNDWIQNDKQETQIVQQYNNGRNP